MTKSNLTDNIKPSATSTAAEIHRWQVLSRDEQLARMKSALNEAAEEPRSTRTMQDIKEATLAKIAKRENG